MRTNQHLGQCRNSTAQTSKSVKHANSNYWGKGPKRIPEKKIGVIEHTAEQIVKTLHVEEQIVLLIRTPTTIYLEPPKNADTNNVLIEEVQNPVTINTSED